MLPLRGLRPTKNNWEILREVNRTDSFGLVKGTYYSLRPIPVRPITWSDQLSQKQHWNVGAWKHTEYSECKFQLQAYCPLTSNKLRNRGTTEENALVLSREISIMRLHLFYIFRRLNQEKPETINSGYGTFLFDLFQKLESNAFDEIVYFINLSFGYFIVVSSSWDKNNEKWV